MLWSLVLFSSTGSAQWLDQTVSMRSGWNTLFLEVQPEPAECDVLFEGLPIESVWFWNRRFNATQFIQDPETLVPGQPDWLVWFPSNTVGRAALNLHAMLGGRTYLIKVADDAEPFQWSFRGKPSLRPPDWVSDSLNLVGFPVSSDNPPTFENFFGDASAHNGQPIYSLNPTGQWEPVVSPETTTLENNLAYWVSSDGPSTFEGPIEVRVDQSTGLDYRSGLVELNLRIRNVSSITRTLTLRKLPSVDPPLGNHPPLAGDVPLAYFHSDFAQDQHGWVPLNTQLEKQDMAPGEEWSLRLEVRRAEMVPTSDPAARYQSLLEVTDNWGMRRVVPVMSDGPLSPPAESLREVGGIAAPVPHRHVGLWIGAASINKVSQPSSSSNPTVPQDTANEFDIRLITHVDAEGQARLLQKVLQMWKDGTRKPDPDNPDEEILDEPGRFVLLTDETLVPNYSGAALRDGVPVGRRVSSAAFGFKDPIPLLDSGDFGSGSISATIDLAYDDPLNPFLHRYHPDHDNLSDRFDQQLPPGVESFTIQRQVELTFTVDPPDALALAGWGDTELGGEYRETISGLHVQPIYIEGFFRLQKASNIPSLNDE